MSITMLTKRGCCCVMLLGCVFASPHAIPHEGSKSQVQAPSQEVVGDLDPVDIALEAQVTLLQVSKEVSRIPAINAWSGGAEGWLKRFPQLQANLQTSLADADRFVKIWTALGENWWLEFIDGRAHAQGPHVFDKSKADAGTETASGAKTLETQYVKYVEFGRAETWRDAPQWTAAMLAEVNAMHGGWECREPLCGNMFDIYDNGQGRILGHPYEDQNPFHADECPTPCTALDKSRSLTRILKEYYHGVNSIKAPVSGGARIAQALPFIAQLYYKLSNVHPFKDANSRVRNLVLQTELVRQGGHPTVLWDNYWGIFQVSSLEEAQQYILNGWCSWEIAYKTSDSPFKPFVLDKESGVPVATAYADYNNKTGACERGSPRLDMKPFKKPEPSQFER